MLAAGASGGDTGKYRKYCWADPGTCPWSPLHRYLVMPIIRTLDHGDINRITVQLPCISAAWRHVPAKYWERKLQL